MHASFPGRANNWLQMHTMPVRLQVPSRAGKVYTSMHVQACAEAPFLDMLKCHVGTNVLDV